MNSPTYAARLDALHKQLKRRPQTARQLAKTLKCSKPTVYTRLAALAESGIFISTEEVRDGKRGPKATLFKLTA